MVTVYGPTHSIILTLVKQQVIRSICSLEKFRYHHHFSGHILKTELFSAAYDKV